MDEHAQSEIVNEPISQPVENLPETGASPASGILRFLMDVAETLILAVILFIGINAVTARIRVDGFSMEPTLHDGEFVIVNKLAYRFGSPERGDVIVFRFPRNPEEEYIKRIIGLPGDTVKIMGGHVYVNGQQIEEPYIAAAPGYESQWDVPADSVFVLGDNRNNSSDSHRWGPVPRENMVGEALFVYWPPQAWGAIGQADTSAATQQSKR